MLTTFLFLSLIFGTTCIYYDDINDSPEKITYYNNKDAAKKLPYTVQVIRIVNNEFLGRGVIISKNLILCNALNIFYKLERNPIRLVKEVKKTSDVRVVSGFTSLYTPYSDINMEFTVHGISKFIWHENSTDFTELWKAMPNNIILLKLVKPLELSFLQKPISIRSTPLMEGELVEVFGFEKLTVLINETFKNFKSRIVPVVDAEDCENEYLEDSIEVHLAEDEFCVRSNHFLYAVNLVIDLHGKLVGLTGRGMPIEGSHDFPGVSTNIIMHREWISSYVDKSISTTTNHRLFNELKL